MKIEHVAYMVKDPPATAAWYVEHLGFEIKRAMDVSPYGHFLADGSGAVMLEIYNNPAARVPDYAAIDPLVLHLAGTSSLVNADYARLVAAGATGIKPPRQGSSGDTIAMLRDPWGFALQLVTRAEPIM